MTLKRDPTLDILKGIGIILVVIGHSGAPELLTQIIYSFHMPLFFIASGFFFKDNWINQKKKFLIKKIKDIYVPFLKWSIIFLLLHNLFFHIGILNDSYGTANGCYPHLFSVKRIIFNFLKITFLMKSYDGFMLGAYWFMRSLFVGILLLYFCSWILDKFIKSKAKSILIISLLFCILGGGMTFFNMQIPYIPQGAYRNLMAVFFLGCGYYAHKYSFLLTNQIVIILSLAAFILFFYIHPTNMSSASGFTNWLTLPVLGLTGFIIIHFVSNTISSYNNTLRNSLIYIGQRTFYILTFHFLMFKPASLLKAYLFGLDWKVIGCHPVVFPRNDNWFWIIYSISAIILSLALTQIINTVFNSRSKDKLNLQ